MGTEHSSIPPLFTPGESRGFFWDIGDKAMNFRELSRFLGAGVLCMTLAACMSNATNSPIGLVTGAIVGALAGSAMTGNFTGAIAGLIVGGIAGNEVGKNSK
jgi:hypothetical protein